MDDDMTMPEGWASHTPLPAAPWTDISIYELHIRDFRYIRSQVGISHYLRSFVHAIKLIAYVHF